ncbi:hypothetical protein RND81_05G262300 [Saponaria officinalis]|uniref:VQ domain-containing protein n=1 Tax=Saponaria officinalis TaxID=3572 RepID=A0AAW1KWT9_SAPOF
MNNKNNNSSSNNKNNNSKEKKMQKSETKDGQDPVVTYFKSPRIIEVRPEEFKGLVQQLTGQSSN